MLRACWVDFDNPGLPSQHTNFVTIFAPPPSLPREYRDEHSQLWTHPPPLAFVFSGMVVGMRRTTHQKRL